MNYTDIINQVVAEAIDREVENRLAAANAVVDTVKTLPTWKDQDLAEWKGSETKAAIFCLREFMLSVGASTAKGLENEFERVQGASSSVGDKEIANLKDQVEKKDRELVALRGDVLERGRRIESLQMELKGVRDALKNHVDSEGKLRKELDDANTRIEELKATVDDRDTRIEELEAEAESDEKDKLIEKYKDMADAISDWANNDMPSLDPDDY